MCCTSAANDGIIVMGFPTVFTAGSMQTVMAQPSPVWRRIGVEFMTLSRFFLQLSSQKFINNQSLIKTFFL